MLSRETLIPWVLFVGDVVLAIACFVVALHSSLDIAVLFVLLGSVTAFSGYALWNGCDELRIP